MKICCISCDIWPPLSKTPKRELRYLEQTSEADSLTANQTVLAYPYKRIHVQDM